MNWNFIFREGFRGLGRNLTMTIALIITTTLSLALVGAGILISQVTSETKALYLSLIHISEPTRLHKVSRMPSSA